MEEENLEVWQMIDQDYGDICGTFITNNPEGLSKCMADAESACSECDDDDPILKEIGWDGTDAQVNGIMEAFKELANKRGIKCIETSVTVYNY